MPGQKLSKPTEGLLRNILSYDDEQIGTIEKNPKQFKLAEIMEYLHSKKMVATCVEAKNCGTNKVGDRYVFNATGFMIKDETCERPCLWAMSNFLHFTYILYDRAASRLDLNGMHFEYISCPDTGCSCGGFGTSMFKISIEDI